MQSVVVSDAFRMQAWEIDRVFYVFAIIEGVATDTVVAAYPNVVITGSTDTSALNAGYFALSEGDEETALCRGQARVLAPRSGLPEV